MNTMIVIGVVLTVSAAVGSAWVVYKGYIIETARAADNARHEKHLLEIWKIKDQAITKRALARAPRAVPKQPEQLFDWDQNAKEAYTP